MAQRREATFGVHRFHGISRLAAVTVLTACISAPPGVPAPEKVVPVIPAPHVARPGGTESWVAPDTLNVWIADTAAYFSGRAFGRRKLAPQVSPGKTWEGVYGGLAAVGLYALALVPLAAEGGFKGVVAPLSVIVWIALALALAALSVVGDLCESLLKRQAGVKDSGRLLPGHGGVLDRIDALLAAMPAAALLAIAFLR